jgi:hypothetical protein
VARRSSKTPDPRLVDPRNRVALSREVMRALDVQAGDYVTFAIDEMGSVRIVKLHIAVIPVPRSWPPKEPG